MKTLINILSVAILLTISTNSNVLANTIIDSVEIRKAQIESIENQLQSYGVPKETIEKYVNEDLRIEKYLIDINAIMKAEMEIEKSKPFIIIDFKYKETNESKFIEFPLG